MCILPDGRPVCACNPACSRSQTPGRRLLPCRFARLLNYLLSRCLEDAPLPDVYVRADPFCNLPNVMSDNFLDVVFRGNSRSQANAVADAHVDRAQQEAFADWPVPRVPTHWGPNLARQMRARYKTCMCNAFHQAFASRMRRFLRSKEELRHRKEGDCSVAISVSPREGPCVVRVVARPRWEPERIAARYHVLERAMTGLRLTPTMANELDAEDLAMIDAERGLLGLRPGEAITDEWLRCTRRDRWVPLLKAFHRWLGVVRAVGVKKAWTLVPTARLIVKQQRINKVIVTWVNTWSSYKGWRCSPVKQQRINKVMISLLHSTIYSLSTWQYSDRKQTQNRL